MLSSQLRYLFLSLSPFQFLMQRVLRARFKKKS